MEQSEPETCRIKDAEALFKRSEFTVLVDLKRTEPSASSDQDKRALLSIGTETNNLHVFTLSGKLGYGDTVKGRDQRPSGSAVRKSRK